MAAMTLTITAEMEEMNDAILLLQEVHARLAKKHGDEFRRLDRAIEALVGNPEDCVEAYWLGDGKIMVAPKGEFTDIFREARRLGVID